MDRADNPRGGLGGGGAPLQGPFYWVKCSEWALICRCWHGGRRRFSRLPHQAVTWELSGRLLIQERQPNEWIPEGAGGITAAASIEKVGRIIHLFIICVKNVLIGIQFNGVCGVVWCVCVRVCLV